MQFDREGRSIRCPRRAHSLLLAAALVLSTGMAWSQSTPAQCGGLLGNTCPTGLVCVGANPTPNSGTCQSPGTVACGGLLGNQCPSGQICIGASTLPNSGACKMPVRITDPVAGALLDHTQRVVRGEVLDNLPSSMGVTVNGVAALIHQGQFCAQIAVDDETTDLTAAISGWSGAGGSHAVSVTVELPEVERIQSFDPQDFIALAPFEATFDLATTSLPLSITVDANGDGQIDVEAPSLDGWVFTYDQPGLYCPPVTAEFTGGATDSTRTALLVYDPAELDAILKGRWAEMKAALASGNIAAALDVIALKDRDTYGEMFQAMSASHLASIDEILTDLSSIRKLRTGRVEYEMFRRHSDGKLISHPVTFRFDVDGVWRVEFL